MSIMFLYLFINVLTQSFSMLKVFAENEKKDRYLTNKYDSYRADFTDLDIVYGSDDGLKRKFT